MIVLLLALLLLAAPAWAADTGAKVPTASAAITSSAGDNDGFEGFTTSVVASVASSNDVYAISTNTGTASAVDGCGTFPQSEDDQHNFTAFAFSVPAGATIDGIEVVIEAKVEATVGSDLVCAALSWDAGTTFTAAKSSGSLTTSDATYTYGGAADTWGRTWSDTETSDANFVLRLMPDPVNSVSRDYSVDLVTVKIYYTEAAGGCTPRRTLLGVGC